MASGSRSWPSWPRAASACTSVIVRRPRSLDGRTETVGVGFRPEIAEGAGRNIGQRIGGKNAGNPEQALAEERKRHVQHEDTRQANGDARHRVAETVERRVDDHDDAIGAVADGRNPQELARDVGNGRIVAEETGQEP